MADSAYRIAFGGQPVDTAFYGSVVSLSVAENTATASTLNLRLSLQLQDDGTWTLLDDSRLALFTSVSLLVGFQGGGGIAGALGGTATSGADGGLEPVFDGYITALDVSYGSTPGSVYLDVSGMDTSVLLSLEEKIATWTNVSDSDIVQQILGAYSIQAQADDTATVHQENDTTIVQRGTDIQFVRSLAQRNGFEFYFETTKGSGTVVAYFRLPRLDGSPQPDLAIQFASQSNLRNFSLRVSGQRPLNVKVAQIDVKQNSPDTEQVSATQLSALGATDLNALLGDTLDGLVTPSDAQAEMLVMGTPTSDATELRTQAQAVSDEASWFVAASGEINGEAYQAVLRPRRLVLVKGVGPLYSGKYYVTSVSHDIKGDGTYTQRFEARRNAVGLDGSEQFGGAGSGLALPGG
jgi:phage protein D